MARKARRREEKKIFFFVKNEMNDHQHCVCILTRTKHTTSLWPEGNDFCGTRCYFTQVEYNPKKKKDVRTRYFNVYSTDLTVSKKVYKMDYNKAVRTMIEVPELTRLH